MNTPSWSLRFRRKSRFYPSNLLIIYLVFFLAFRQNQIKSLGPPPPLSFLTPAILGVRNRNRKEKPPKKSTEISPFRMNLRFPRVGFLVIPSANREVSFLFWDWAGSFPNFIRFLQARVKKFAYSQIGID